jgi:hypothetical protein
MGTAMEFFPMRATCIFLNLLCALPLLASEAERVQVKLDASEAECVLAILAKRKEARPITDADWHALFATEPYRRLKEREAAVHRDFSDEDFRKFVLSDELAQRYDDLAAVLCNSSSKVLLLFSNLGRWPYIELHRVVTVEIEDVKQCHPGLENSRRPLHKGCHGNAGRRKVHREQDVLDCRHGFDSHIGFMIH